jgi:hypothetical protein
VNRRFGAVVCRDIVPGAAGTQDVQDTVEHMENVSAFSCQENQRFSVGCGGRIGVGRCAALLAGGISGQSPRDHHQFPGRPYPGVLSERSYIWDDLVVNCRPR